MSIAILSLVGLLIVIIVSCVLPKINPGLLAILTTILLGSLFTDLSLKVLVGAFPTELFLLLVSICLVFGMANNNGTLPAITNKLVDLIKGRVLLLPILFFFLAFLLSALGPGNIASVALLASLAMVLAHQYKISPLLTAIMIATGANAGAFSPFAPTGIVGIRLMEEIGLQSKSLPWVVFGAAAVLQSLTAFLAYGIFLIRRKKRLKNHTETEFKLANEIINLKKKKLSFGKKQWLTILGIFMMISGVVFFHVPLLIMSLSTVVFFALFNLDDPEEILSKLPWSTILMVTGISILIGLMEKTGGLDLATSLIASVTAPEYINAMLAFITGVVSAFSSSSGVVMPAFIPLIPGLAEKMGLDNIVAMVTSVAVGSHMVDVSPLSTLGALAIAAMPDQSQKDRVFKWLLIWGMSMSIVGAIIAYVLLDVAKFM